MVLAVALAAVSATLFFLGDESMRRNEIIQAIMDDADNQNYTVFAVAPFRQQEGMLPGALVLTDKVKGELAIHDALINNGSVQLLSGIYPREGIEESLIAFSVEIQESSWRFG